MCLGGRGIALYKTATPSHEPQGPRVQFADHFYFKSFSLFSFICSYVQVPKKPEKGIGSLRPEVKSIANCPTWVLGAEFKSLEEKQTLLPAESL